VDRLRAPRKALAHLRGDPKLARVIERVGPFKMTLRIEGSHFDHVVRAIVYQQLSGKAARTIHGRVMDLFGGRPPTPEELAGTSDDRLRSAGLSRQKLGYIKDLAARVAARDVAMDSLHELPDAEIIATLTRVKGVGVWTAQMFLMFRLGRLDVLPIADLGIQTAVQRAYKLRKRPTPAQVEKLGSRWRPYATVASWYLWRSLE
jgi:DNA-3-methyladenine glycosylase II